MDYRILVLLLVAQLGMAQTTLRGTVLDQETYLPIENVKVWSDNTEQAKTDEEGKFEIVVKKTPVELSFMVDNYQSISKTINEHQNGLEVYLQPIIRLNEIQIQALRKKEFALRRMKDVEGTSILAGKKTEVILLDQLTANMAVNNARQIFGQVVGLNIFDYNDGGLQLGVGGRGLNPNRSANFNMRQNGYDISADVLGYPESYYTPPSEALQEIQIIRGAASLQYGTQFGGMINFKFKEPNKHKKFDFTTRNTIGSNGLYTNFTSVGGTVGKVGYYGFLNIKDGSSFRPNSDFKSNNYFGHLDYQMNDKTKLSAEYTHFHYLAQQAGGLTDRQFEIDPNFSNRERNWFQVDWNLFDFKVEHTFSENSKFSTHIFALNSERDALGFRTNRVSQEDEPNQPRDLLKADFRNWGFESRFLQNYNLWNQQQVFLLGVKYYDAHNKAQQGPGTRASDDNFDYDYDATPNYPHQSTFDYPNKNIAFFGETILHLNDKFSVTPGFRYEWINTQAHGSYKYLELDLDDNILYEELKAVDVEKKRDFFLFGVGLSYKNPQIEYYANISQNYRSVTFSDIHISNPNRFVADDITDETGYTFDLGVRGKYKKYISYDTNVFTLLYDNRIGDYNRTSDGKRGRDNIGKAVIYGLEFFSDFDLDEIFNIENNNYAINYFVNTALTHSAYDKAKVEGANAINGNKVEYVPTLNLKTGLGFGYRNFTTQWQLTYLTEQFTDADNTQYSSDPINEGINGSIPDYMVLDWSAAYRYKRFKLEGSINNLLNHKYFVRRASGYPGPGIIPSEPINWALTLQFEF